jgi:hypothetical protein
VGGNARIAVCWLAAKANKRRPAQSHPQLWPEIGHNVVASAANGVSYGDGSIGIAAISISARRITLCAGYLRRLKRLEP